MSHVHVIGAGLAGLAAALSLTAAGRAVTLHEAGPAAGGRCRSYFDKELGLRIDNGNHLLLSGNRAARAYIEEIGATECFRSLGNATFPFLDVRSGESWSIRPNRGRIPWWILVRGRRVPDTRLSDYLRLARMVTIRDDRTVYQAMRRGWLYWRLVEPLAVAALNTRSQAGLARLLAAVMRETLMRGAEACIPVLPKEGLSEALVDPALATLAARGAAVRVNNRIAELVIETGRVTALRGPAGRIDLGPGDGVVLAVPPWAAADLLPALVVPDAFEAILNIHFRTLANPGDLLAEAGFIGLTSSVAEWLFLKRDHVSVTISAANAMVDEPARAIASQVWPNVRQALKLPAGQDPTGPDPTGPDPAGPDPTEQDPAGQDPTGQDADGRDGEMPPFRVVKERRATFAATAAQERRRPGARTTLAANLAIAGDWTDTGLPATIEGAIRSGRSAAQVVLSL